METSKRKNELLIVLGAFGGLALNYPFLALFSKERFLFGIPILFIFLFSFWALFIVVMAFFLRKKEPAKPGSKPPSWIANY